MPSTVISERGRGNINGNQLSPDSDDGKTASYDDSFIGSVVRYIDGIAEAFHKLPEVHNEVLDEAVESRLSMLRSLPGIDASTLKHIEPVVAENTRFLHSREWSTSWEKMLVTRPALENLLMTVGFVVLPFIVLILTFGGHHFDFGSVPTFLASIFAFLIFGTIIWQVARVLRFATTRRILGTRKIAIAATVILLTILSATDRDRISAFTRRYTHDVPISMGHYYSQVLWATAVHNALWVLACILTLRALSVGFEYFIKSLILSRATKSSSAVLYSAAIQDSLLAVAHTLSEYLNAREEGDIASVPHKVRTYVIDKLAEIARTIEGPWTRSLRTGYRSTDERIARIGLNIGHSFRNLQYHAVFGGQHFATIRDDCIQAYVNALEGNWELIAVDDERFKSLRVTRFKAVIRRLAAMILPVLFAFGAIRVMPRSMDSYKPFLILASTLLAFVEIVALIDPDIVERVNMVVNAANSIRRAPKS